MHQTRLLARAFFDRLFESELMPEGLPQVQLVLWSILLAATPTTAMPLVFLKKYAHDQFYKPLGPEMAADRMILLTLSMMAIGVVGLVIWDGVFPDRRDVRILGPLPIKTRRFVVARLAAIGRVYVMFSTAICVLQSVLFGMIASGYGAPVSRLHGIAAHLVTVFLACTFVFCFLVAAQCLLLLLFGRRTALAASMVFQILFAISLVQLVVFLPDLGRVLREGGRSHEGLSAIAALPPTWFFGVYEVLAGTADAGAFALARIAVGSTLLSTALAIGLYAASYDLLSRRALEGAAPTRGRARQLALARAAQLSRTVSRPLTVAVRQFTVRTLTRSRSHRMMLAIYAGIALAFVISSAVSVAFRNGGGVWQPGLAMLSMPLIIQFLMLVALRVITSVPSEPKARWVFRAAEPADRPGALNGLGDTMMMLVVWPTVGFALLQGLLFWTVTAAISHAVFCLVLGRLLAETLLLNTDKLPFACTYFPGKSRVFALWPIYLSAFFFYSIVFAQIDRVMLSRHRALAIWCLALTLATQAVVLLRRRFLNALPGLRFEEEDPDRIFQGFNLSEGIAAESRPPLNAQIPTPGSPGESLVRARSA
jgi:hypothetical protein